MKINLICTSFLLNKLKRKASLRLNYDTLLAFHVFFFTFKRKVIAFSPLISLAEIFSHILKHLMWYVLYLHVN